MTRHLSYHRRPRLAALISSVCLTGLAVTPVSALAGQADDEITFAQVLAAPGDRDLNLAFATQRIEAGDLLSAAATLERLLFGDPNWDAARVLYVSVLYRLGDYAAAAREVDILDRRPLSADAQAELDRYTRRTPSALRESRTGGYVAFGYAHDDNALSLIAEDGGALSSTTSVDSLTLRGGLSVEKAVSAAKPIYFYAGVDGYAKQFQDVDGADGYTVANGRAGLRGRYVGGDWAAGVVGRHISVDGDAYLAEIGGVAKLGRDLSAKTTIGLTASYFDQSYEPVLGELEVTSDGRSGDRVDVSGFVQHGFSSRLRAHGRLVYRDKSADGDANLAYTFVAGQAGADLGLGRGVTLDVDAIYRDYDYSGSLGRADEFTFLRGAVKVPLSAVAPGVIGTAADGVSVTGAISRTERTSSLNLYDFENVGAEIFLTWEFGQ